MPSMFFPDEPVPLDAVREMAALLKANGLGKIALESDTEGVGRLRLNLKRETFTLAPVVGAPESVEAVALPLEEVEASVEPELITARGVLAPCVGVYRAPKKPLQVGDAVKNGQVVAVVESLRVPNEVVAPFDGTVVELPSLEGQGVEWGQTLLVLEPAS